VTRPGETGIAVFNPRDNKRGNGTGGKKKKKRLRALKKRNARKEKFTFKGKQGKRAP